MDEARMRVKLTFTESVLGLSPSNENIYRDYIASRAPKPDEIEDEEVAALDESKLMTIFPKDENGNPFFWDYQIRGFFKGACGALRKLSYTKSSKVKAYKKLVDLLIFIDERKIPIRFNGEIGSCQRPLRASTPMGERVALAMSEEVPAGATIQFTILMLDAKDKELVKEWLNYGRLNGLSQWRNSGKGRFLWEELDAKGNAIGGNKSLYE